MVSATNEDTLSVLDTDGCKLEHETMCDERGNQLPLAPSKVQKALLRVREAAAGLGFDTCYKLAALTLSSAGGLPTSDSDRANSVKNPYNVRHLQQKQRAVCQDVLEQWEHQTALLHCFCTLGTIEQLRGSPANATYTSSCFQHNPRCFVTSNLCAFWSVGGRFAAKIAYWCIFSAICKVRQRSGRNR